MSKTNSFVGDETTKRIVSHRLKQIETRIQRQIVIEDGKIVSDTGPLITTKTHEDVKDNLEEIDAKFNISKQDLNHMCECHTKDNNRSTPKSYMFGYDQQSFSSANEKPTNMKTNKKTANSSKGTNSENYFYFGEKSNSKNYINKVHAPNNSPMAGRNKFSKIHKDNNNNEISSDDGIEQDCQIGYEYDQQYVKFK